MVIVANKPKTHQKSASPTKPLKDLSVLCASASLREKYSNYFRTGEMDWSSANASWYSADTIAATLGAGVSAGVGSYVPNKLGLTKVELSHTGALINLGASLSGETAKYVIYLAENMRLGNGLDSFEQAFDDMGGLTLNLLNVATIARLFGANLDIANAMSVGLFELHLTNDGVSGKIGTSGIDVSRILLDFTIGGVEERRLTESEWNEFEPILKDTVKSLDEMINEINDYIYGSSNTISPEITEGAKKWLSSDVDWSSPEAMQGLVNDLLKIRLNLSSLTINNFRMVDSGDNFNALVFPTGRHIHLDKTLFGSHTIGTFGSGATNTQQGILVHESTHFIRVLGTNLFGRPAEVYRTNDLKWTATPRNAQNWRFFFEEYAYGKR